MPFGLTGAPATF